MMPEYRWQWIVETFNRAARLPLEQRRAFVEDVCQNDEDLRREILALIEADDEQSDLLDRPLFDLGLTLLTSRRVGERISHYEVLKLIGKGGMGEVYLAQDIENGQKVALKLLNAEALADPERVRRFRQEARTATLIRHANVAQVYEVGETTKNQFIAMEFVDGVTLRQRLKVEMTLGEALTIAEQVAAALNAAHESGIIHRDLKPENVMIQCDGQVKVLDFGLAKLIRPNTFQTAPRNSTVQANLLTYNNSTAYGFVFGTAAYMSPEQARGQKTDERTDSWSFGVLLYEMIAGAPPFRGKTNMDIIASVLTSQPEPLGAVFPTLPPDLVKLVNGLLKKEPNERPETCRTIRDDLRYILERLQDDSILSSARLILVNRTKQTLSGGHQITSDRSEVTAENTLRNVWNKSEFQKVLVILIGVFVMTTIVGSGYLLLVRPNKPTADQSENAVKDSHKTIRNKEAESEYQAGRYIWSKRQVEEMPRALAHFQKAIELDPGFARAYSGLADAYMWGGNPNLTRKEQLAHVKAATQRALALDPNLAEAHTTLAAVLAGEWNWVEAEREYRKAIEVNPEYPTAHHWYAEFLTFIGRDDEAVEHINKALELDPLSFAILNDAMTIHWYIGRYDEALAKAEKMIAFDKRYERRARLWMSRLYVHLGNIKKGRKEFKLYEKLTAGKESAEENASFYSLIRDKEKAIRYLKKVETSGDAVKQSLRFAQFYASFGMNDEAFQWLEVAFENRDPSIVALAANPDFDSLRSDVRYMVMLERLRLAAFWKNKLNM